MTVRLITLVFALATAASLPSAEPPQRFTEPFATVVHSGDTIVATLSQEAGRSLIFYILDSKEEGTISPGKSFTLRGGSSLIVGEHHLGYWITCHITPVPGLQIDSRLDDPIHGTSQ